MVVFVFLIKHMDVSIYHDISMHKNLLTEIFNILRKLTCAAENK